MKKPPWEGKNEKANNQKEGQHIDYRLVIFNQMSRMLGFIMKQKSKIIEATIRKNTALER